MLVPRRFLIHVTSLQDFNPPHWLMTNFQSYDNAVLCPGNPDEKFVSACKDKRGCVRGVRGNGDVAAFIDKSSVTDHSGKQSQCIVRRVDWDMLCERSSQYPLCSKSCQSLRSTLHSLVSRQSNESASNTSASSHTKHRDLTPAEKYERLKIFIVLSKSQTRRWNDYKQKLTNLLQNSLRVFKIMMLPIYHISSQKWAQLWKTDSHWILPYAYFGISKSAIIA